MSPITRARLLWGASVALALITPLYVIGCAVLANTPNDTVDRVGASLGGTSDGFFGAGFSLAIGFLLFGGLASAAGLVLAPVAAFLAVWPTRTPEQGGTIFQIGVAASIAVPALFLVALMLETGFHAGDNALMGTLALGLPAISVGAMIALWRLGKRPALAPSDGRRGDGS